LASYLLKEDGYKLLKEDIYSILLESSMPNIPTYFEEIIEQPKVIFVKKDIDVKFVVK